MSRHVTTAKVENPKAARVTEKRCAECQQVKPASDFSRYGYVTNQDKASERLDSRCKRCRASAKRARYGETARVVQRAYRAKNRVSRRQKDRVYRSRNIEKWRRSKVESQARRRARARGVTVDCRSGLCRAVLELARVGDKYLDAYTGELIDKPTLDHVVSLAAGGAHSFENLCVTSFSNNASKNTKPMLVWMAQKAALS